MEANSVTGQKTAGQTHHHLSFHSSGTGMNLKVREGHQSKAKYRSGAFFFGRVLHFLALKAQLGLVVLVSAFVMVNTVWSVSCLLFSYTHGAPCPAICKSGGHVPPCHMESAPLFHSRLSTMIWTANRCLVIWR